MLNRVTRVGFISKLYAFKPIVLCMLKCVLYNDCFRFSATYLFLLFRDYFSLSVYFKISGFTEKKQYTNASNVNSLSLIRRANFSREICNILRICELLSSNRPYKFDIIID